MKFTMYHNFSTYVIEHGIEKAAEIAKSLGFSGVEIFSDDVTDAENAIKNVEEAIHAKRVLEEYGLVVNCYSVYAGIYRNPSGVESLMKQLDIAAALGSPYFHHTLLPWLELWDGAPEYKGAVQEVVEVAAQIADYADTLGVTCIYEDQGYYVNGVEGFRGFWNQMKKRCNNIGICGDLGNILFVNETPEVFLKEYVHDVCHVHVKDYIKKRAKESPGRYWLGAKDDCWLRDTMIGSGVVDFETCMNILKDAGYDGYFALENCHPEPYEEGVYQAMEYLNRFW